MCSMDTWLVNIRGFATIGYEAFNEIPLGLSYSPDPSLPAFVPPTRKGLGTKLESLVSFAIHELAGPW